MRFFFGLRICASVAVLGLCAGASEARDGWAARPTPRPTQKAALPADLERDGFARRAASIPLYRGPVGAGAWVVMDADSGRVLAGRNVDHKMFPASTTKTMTGLLAVESNRLNEVVTISANPPQVGESSVHLLQNEKFRLHDLLRAAMIKSANDSCVAIAEAVSGSEKSFVALMNRRARELGARNTHFANPHGLHDAGHFTTARDLALIARAAMRLPAFEAVARARESSIHGNWKIGPERPLYNRNRLLFRWAQCDGVKTGYTRQAGKCLIASATRRDPRTGRSWRLIAVVLKSRDTYSDAYNALVHAGFKRFEPRVVLQKTRDLQPPPLPDGRQLQVRVPRNLSVPLAAGEKPVLKYALLSGPEAKREVRQGQRVGSVEVHVASGRVASLPVYASQYSSVPILARLSPSAPPARSFWGWFLLGLGALFAVAAVRPRRRRRRSGARRPRPTT